MRLEWCGAILLSCVGPCVGWCGGGPRPCNVNGDCSGTSGVGGVGTTATGLGCALTCRFGGTSGTLVQQPMGPQAISE